MIENATNDELTSDQQNTVQEIEWRKTRYFLYVFFNILSDSYCLYMILLCISVLLGIVLNHLLFVFLVSFLIVQSPSMRGLLQAIWEPRSAIFSAMVLIFLIIYMLATVYYFEFWKYYEDEMCYSFWSCYVYSFDQSFRNGGIGQALTNSYEFKDEDVVFQYDKIIFDNLEFFLISLLMANILSGIITDKFVELRTRREENIANFNSACCI